MRLKVRGESAAKVHVKCSRCGFRRAAPLGSDEAVKRICPECGHRLRIGVRREAKAPPRRYDFQIGVGAFLLGLLVGPMLLTGVVTQGEPSASPELDIFLASVVAGVVSAALVLGAVRTLRR
jgi:DNA-directed RNA polymerase subunit RPC12/RpoP